MESQEAQRVQIFCFHEPQHNLKVAWLRRNFGDILLSMHEHYLVTVFSTILEQGRKGDLSPCPCASHGSA